MFAGRLSCRPPRLHVFVPRSLTTTTTPPPNSRFVPLASLETTDDGQLEGEQAGLDVDSRSHRPRPENRRPVPPSPAFYTARSLYYDTLVQLQTALSLSRRALRAQHLLPLPPFALRALPPAQPAWVNKAEMSLSLQAPLTARMYKRVVTLLKELDQCERIARVAHSTELENAITDITKGFESKKGIQARDTRIRAREAKEKGPLDKYGRSYTVGRRKTSTARVWMIEVHKPKVGASEPAVNTTSILSSSNPTAPSPPSSTILINSVPISNYFPLPADRERVLRPLKLAGLLGAFNIFALVRAGGTSGQSGAIALAVAKGCVAHVPEVEPILKKAKLMRRDPRMVERKKTGLAKARKRYTWVKR
ncbi:ribosomal protein S9/S16-domain-containing protein [Pisolithus marmoratus]|nr:ribosomal protein S9/S16-domain-containing protein [Pisolithus marmoratus]